MKSPSGFSLRSMIPAARRSRAERRLRPRITDAHLEDRNLLSASTVYPLSPDWVAPLQIRAGSDGNLWYSDSGYVGRISPTTGTVTEFPIDGQNYANWITEGPGGNIWFAQPADGGSTIGKITPDGTITQFPLPDAGENISSQNPTAITDGPDGNLWFINDSNDIGYMTPTGIVLELPMDYPESPYKITAGNDGNLWFTDPGANSIGRITTLGVVTEFPLPSDHSGPDAIIAGPDGNVWFTEIGKVGKIDPSGNITEFTTPTQTSGFPDITVGSDGALWFVEDDVDQIGRVSTAGVVTEYPLPQTPANNPGFHGIADHPVTIASGADGRLWVLDIGENAGIMAVSLDQPLGPALIPTLPMNGLAASGPVSAFHDPDAAATAGDFTAAINWGDGTITVGTITAASGGNFFVSGTHTYATSGTYSIYTVITDIDASHDLGGGTLITGNSYTTATGGGVGEQGTPVPGTKHPGSKKIHHPVKKPTHHPAPKPHKKAAPHKSHGHAVGVKAIAQGAETSHANSHLVTTVSKDSIPKPPVHSLTTRVR
jgi:streptogramin lyase